MTNKLYISGLLGLLASIIVGVGEYTLHYDALARFTEGGFTFMQGISDERSTRGHFLGVFGATLYPVAVSYTHLTLPTILLV